MPLFLSNQMLKESVERLSTAAVVTSLSDYLIFKRALINTQDTSTIKIKSKKDYVVTGTKSQPFVQAVDEFTLCVPAKIFRSNPQMPNPYYLPFGSGRDKTLGYRTNKYPSNGSSDTVSRWQSRRSKPIELVPNSSPKAFRILSLTKDELGEFFLLKGEGRNSVGKKPSIIDAAIWWFRFTDLESVFMGEPTGKQLAEQFICDIGINNVELSTLFLPIVNK